MSPAWRLPPARLKKCRDFWNGCSEANDAQSSGFSLQGERLKKKAAKKPRKRPRKGLKKGRRKTPDRNRRDRRNPAATDNLHLHLALQPVLYTDLLHDIQLCFQPVYMFFCILQNFLEKLSRNVILGSFARGNGAKQGLPRSHLEFKIALDTLLHFFTNQKLAE